MKKIIITALVLASFASCNKAKIRTCVIDTYDGTRYTIISDKELTRVEMAAYEQELQKQNTPVNGEAAKVKCH